MQINRKLTVGIVTLLVAALAGGAYAATQSGGGTSRQAFLNDVAKRLHITSQQLNSALQGAYADRLQALVAAGRITQAQANSIEKSANRNGVAGRFGGPRAFFGGPGAFFGGRFGPGTGPGPGPGPGPGFAPMLRNFRNAKNGPGMPGFPIGPGQLKKLQFFRGRGGVGPALGFGGFAFGFGGLGLGFGLGVGAEAKAAESYLGLTQKQLMTDLSSGKTLAQIATAQGKTTAGLTSALTTALGSRLDKLVANKFLTRAQEQKLLSRASTIISKVITVKLSMFQPGFRGFRLPAKPLLKPSTKSNGPALFAPAAPPAPFQHA